MGDVIVEVRGWVHAAGPSELWGCREVLWWEDENGEVSVMHGVETGRVMGGVRGRSRSEDRSVRGRLLVI